MARTAALLAALALVLAACGGGEAGADVASLADPGSASSDTTATTAESEDPASDAETSALEWAACMRDNGVDVADPTVDADGNVQLGGPGDPGGAGAGEEGAGGFDEDARTAFEACGDLLEGAFFGGGGRGDFDPTELEDQMLEFAACMRDNGVDMDDPTFAAPGEAGGGDAAEDGEGAGPGRRFGGVGGDFDPDDPVFQAAQEACGDLLGGFGPGGGGPGGAPGAGGEAQSDA